jgi:cytochrome c553
MPLRFSFVVIWIYLVARAAAAMPPNPNPPGLEIAFHRTVQPFLETYCVSCHGKETTKADLDLSRYTNVARVTTGFTHWELVLERLEAGDMPSEKAKHFPSDPLRDEVVAWIRSFRQAEAT